MGHGLGLAVRKVDKVKNHDNHEQNNQKTRIGRIYLYIYSRKKIEERASLAPMFQFETCNMTAYRSVGNKMHVNDSDWRHHKNQTNE